jgi:hypothetical protein
MYHLFRTKSLARSRHGLKLGSVWKRFIHIHSTLRLDYLSLSSILLKITFNIITVTNRYEIIIIIIIISYSTTIPLFSSGLVPQRKGGGDEKLNIHFHLVTRLKRMEIYRHFPTRLHDLVVN